jgi:hypothetical protein
MKLKSLISFLILLSACTFSCKKSSPTDNTPVVKNKYLVKAAVGTNATIYTYDSKKRLATIVIGNNSTTYSYDDQHLRSVDLEIGGNVSTRVYSEFKYAGEEINSISQKTYVSDTLKKENTISYFYDNGRVKEIRSGTEVTTFTYDSNNNIITNVYKGPVTISITSVYDDKKSRFVNSLTKYLVYPSVDAGNDRYSHNNIVQNTSELNGKSTVTKYTYTYDNEGYPLTSNDGRTTTTYSYSTLD